MRNIAEKEKVLAGIIRGMKFDQRVLEHALASFVLEKFSYEPEPALVFLKDLKRRLEENKR